HHGKPCQAQTREHMTAMMPVRIGQLGWWGENGYRAHVPQYTVSSERDTCSRSTPSQIQRPPLSGRPQSPLTNVSGQESMPPLWHIILLTRTTSRTALLLSSRSELWWKTARLRWPESPHRSSRYPLHAGA